MTRIGAVFNPYHNAPQAFRAAVETAEEAGVPELWLWEDCFRESAYASVGAALAWTERMTVGLGIAPLPLRNVALTAMEVATVAQLFPGRFLPGFGHGVQEWMAQVGAKPASPLTLMREQLTALRALLAGEEVTVAGRYVTLDKVRLDWVPENPPPLLGAGVGPKTLALTGEVADGTIFVSGIQRSALAQQISTVRDAAAAAGRPRPQIVVYVATAFGEGAEERVRTEVAGSVLLAEAGAWGDADDVALTATRYAELGVDTVVLQPAVGEPDLASFLKNAAEVAKIVG